MSAHPHVAKARSAPVGHRHSIPFGAEVIDEQGRFRIWAPAQSSLMLVLDGRTPIRMPAAADGWHESLSRRELEPGTSSR
jgi:1,4-alpha-glucan branching enzyme